MQKQWTVAQLKTLVLKLLDESSPKNDLTAKIPVFMDTAQKEVSLYCPIRAMWIAETGGTVPDTLRKVLSVRAEDGTAVPYQTRAGTDGIVLKAESYPVLVEYEKIPENITAETPQDTLLELPERAVLAMAYYIAAQCNSLEYDQRFFQSFYAQYQGKLQNLASDPEGVQFSVTADTCLPDWM